MLAPWGILPHSLPLAFLPAVHFQPSPSTGPDSIPTHFVLSPISYKAGMKPSSPTWTPLTNSETTTHRTPILETGEPGVESRPNYSNPESFNGNSISLLAQVPPAKLSLQPLLLQHHSWRCYSIFTSVPMSNESYTKAAPQQMGWTAKLSLVLHVSLQAAGSTGTWQA